MTPISLYLSTRNPQPEDSKYFDGIFVPYRETVGRVYPEHRNHPYVTFSVLGDTIGLQQHPERAAVAVTGEKALIHENPYDGFAWSWVCPLEPTHRTHLLALLQEVPQDTVVILEDLQFPNEQYCACPRCTQDRAHRGPTDLQTWRIRVIQEWWQDIQRVRNGKYAWTLHPDPYALETRYGVDLESLEVDLEFLHFPIYCTSYGLTYWMEILVPAILQRFTQYRVLLELYAEEPPIAGLWKALFVLTKYRPDGIVLYDSRQRYQDLARALVKDRDLQKKVLAISDPVFQDLVERIRSWV